VLAGGLPSSAAVNRIKQSGAGVFALLRPSALRASSYAMGVDAIISEGSEAGRAYRTVSTGVLAQEILPHLADVYGLRRRGIGRGEAMLAYLEMGGVWVHSHPFCLRS